MKKVLAKKWIKALRSGEYKQGKLKLYTAEDNSYCCLGVLNKLNSNKEKSDANLYYTHQELGLTCPAGSIKYGVHEPCYLSTLNDAGLKTCNTFNLNGEFTLESFNFDEIADVIQLEYVEGI